MAANLRRGNLPTETTMARFMYYIIKQLDVRGVDWTEVAANMDITNGHAARMRYARYKNQVEGVQPRPREPRTPGSAREKKGPGRPVKKQKVEKKEEGDEGVKKEAGVDDGRGDKVGKVKCEKDADGNPMPTAKMAGGGTLGPGAGIKREFGDVDGDEEQNENNACDLTSWNGSMVEPRQSLSRTGSATKMKSEPVEDGGSPRRGSDGRGGRTADADGDADAPGETIDPAELSAMSTTKQITDDTPSAVAFADSTSPQTSPRAISPALLVSNLRPHQQATTTNPQFAQTQTTIPNMQHLQLNTPMSMPMQHSNTPPPPPPSHLASKAGSLYGHSNHNVSIYPLPSYNTYPNGNGNQMAGQSPATTSSAPFSHPSSPVNGDYEHPQQQQQAYTMTAMGGAYDMNNGVGMMMTQHQHQHPHQHQGGFVGMLHDPSFPRADGQFYGGGGVGGGYGGWEGMY